MVDEPPRKLADEDLVDPAACSSRAAMPTTSPVTSRWRASAAVATTSPVSKPIRTSRLDSVLFEELRVQRGDACTDVVCGARGAESIVLVRDRCSESRHDRVAGKLLDRTPVASQHRGDDLEVALQHASERLGIERF